jgi:hypothetical protein
MEGKENKIREFRFEKKWLKEDDFMPRVARIWVHPVKAKESLALFQANLKNVEKKLSKDRVPTSEAEISRRKKSSLN